ncbi:hypothetical protein [Pedobacter gandavensis]|uniref:hypothetical protein n=1 Tax=Pedobacter gandavensis TaxID=2679963 RepID=UPI00292EE809|nr:hypothetical protein [Pedobacter gandavensis]
MKKLIIMSLLGVMGILPFRAAAQISLNINIGSQPLWGPVGYDHVEYYYLPDVESYYYVPKQQFIYQDRGKWIFSRTLPSRYRNYDLYNGYKVVVNSRDPYRNFDNDRRQYARYKNVRTQQVIRNSNDKRYYVVKGHPHGMPPGQAKKYSTRVTRPQARDSRGTERIGRTEERAGRGNDQGNRGNDQGKRGNEREKRGN